MFLYNLLKGQRIPSGMASNEIKRFVIVGGGNSAHVLAGLLSSVEGNQVNWYAPFQDEASRIKQGLAENGGITLINPDSTTTSGHPTLVTKDPSEAMKGAQLVLIPLPSFAIPQMLKDIEPYVPNGCIIGGLPAQEGFQWTAINILSKHKVDIFGLDKLPYNCRIEEFGKRVRVYKYKAGLRVATFPRENAGKVADILNASIPHTGIIPVSTFLTVTLAPSNQCIHPARMYGLYHGAKDGYKEKVLFYETMDDVSAELIQGVSDELQAIAKAAGIALKQTVELPDVQQGLRNTYKFEDDSSLKQMMRTADGFQGLYAPMVEKDGKWFVDLNSRYLTEDIPALCVCRGIAMILNVATPTIDKLILWGQKVIKKSYLIPSPKNPEELTLDGKDISETGVPEAFGITSVDDPRFV